MTESLDLDNLLKIDESQENEFFLIMDQELKTIFEKLKEKQILPLLWKHEIIFEWEQLEEEHGKICKTLLDYFQYKKRHWDLNKQMLILSHLWSYNQTIYKFSVLIPKEIEELLRNNPEIENNYSNLYKQLVIMNSINKKNVNIKEIEDMKNRYEKTQTVIEENMLIINEYEEKIKELFNVEQ